MREMDGEAGKVPESRPPFLLVAVLLGAAAASRFFAIAAAPGEIDEAVFAGAVTHFNLFDLSPQAPGFPVWILLGKLFLPLFVSPFQTLAALSTILAALAIPALYVWGRSLVGPWAALSGTLLAAALPVVWVNGGRAFSDSPSTAFFLLSLAALSAWAERDEKTPRGGSVALAAAAGILASAGAGVRPHLVAAFGPLLLVLAVRIFRRDARAALAFVVAGLAGTAAWATWLLVEAGGLAGLKASLAERAGFRSQALSTGTLGTLYDSFLVKDFVSPKRAVAVLAVAAAGFVFVWLRNRRGALDIAVFLVPTFLSLWYLHSRAMSRYSIPFAICVALLFAAGLEGILRRRTAGLAATLVAAAWFSRESWIEARESAGTVPPPSAAIFELERYVHPGRETIIADDVFHAFLRTERWEGRLVAWGYLDSEFVAAPLQMNRRLVRLADFTSEPDYPPGRDGGWRVWWRGGRVAEALGNRRLLTVGLRDPAPPIFGPGFGVKESEAGKPSFRWAGPAAHLFVPGLQGPPAALLAGERPSAAGPTTLTVVEVPSGRVVLRQKVEPGTFDLAIIDTPVYGPLERPRQYVLSCDRTVPLPPLEGGMRPREGCFVFKEATYSAPPGKLWERFGAEYRVDVGSPSDGWAGLEGFFPRETEPKTGLDFRWTSHESSLVWVPVPPFVPRQLAVRGRTPGRGEVDVAVTVAGISSGTMRFTSGDFSEARVDLYQPAIAALTGPVPVRIVLSSATFSPKRAGAGEDPRELGIVVDRVVLR